MAATPNTASAPHRAVDDPSWAWAPYAPGKERPWTLGQAGHLYRRAGFGANWRQLSRALSDGPQRTVDLLLQPASDLTAFNRTHDGYEKMVTRGTDGQQLRAWWLRRMIETPHPLLEKMTLFWHGYFAVTAERVPELRLVARHVQTLRQHALGSFANLLSAVASDPALLISLGAQANRKARPAEPLARVFLDQYTVGPGQYSEQDAHELNRALTGVFILQGELRQIPSEQDTGSKRLFGKEGAFGRDDAVRILLAQPATARRIVSQLYRWFISETAEPSGALIEPLAASFAKDFNIARVVETMLRSNLFFSPAAYRQRVKSPVEFALGLTRALENTVGTVKLGADLAALGQDLYRPPTIHGWAGGPAWINRFTLLRRAAVAHRLLMGKDDSKLDPAAIATTHNRSSAATEFWTELLLQGDIAPETRTALLAESVKPVAAMNAEGKEQSRRMAALIATLPEFHLA